MPNQLNLIKFILLCIFISGCTTQPGKVKFPLSETEFKKPKTVEATPTIRQIPDSLPNAKYTIEKGQLVKRDQSIPLKIAIKKKVGQPIITENLLNKLKTPISPKKQLTGTPQKIAAKGKIVPALGKVVKAGKPISKPYGHPIGRDDDNYGLRNISQDQNLPGTRGYALLEDSQGRIWIGTDNGLAILEGEEIKIYTTREGLSNNRVYSLLESTSGAIWIGTYGGGVNVFESGSFTHYGTEEGLSNNRVYSLLESATGAIWIATEGGIDILESGSFTHYGTEEGLGSNRAYSLLESNTGAIWIGSMDGGVDVFESGSFTHYDTEEGLSNNSVWSLLESTTGAIWIGTDEGVDVFEAGSFTHYGAQEGLSSERIFNLLESSTGEIWIGTAAGVNIFESGSFTHYSTEEGLSSNNIWSLMESTTGAIWIGTYRAGVDVLMSDLFTHYDVKEGASSNRVWSLMESTTGAIWAGTAGGGVNVLESGKFTHYGIQEGLKGDYVSSLLESSKGAIWIGTYGAKGGVDVLEAGSFTHYGTQEGLSSNRVRSLLESSTGAIWIGTYGGGVDVFEAGSFTHYGTEEGVSSNSVWSLLESSTGAIWIGTMGGGLSVFESGRFLHYGTKEGLSSNSVYSLLESATGAIWIGTAGGGIDIFEAGSFTHYGIQEGLADNTVNQLAMDSLGDVWAGTSTGLTRFTAKEEGYQLTSWNKTHGFKYIDFIGPGNPMLFTKTDEVSEKGTMWSGVGGVLTAFEPPLADTLKPTMFLTAIDIGQKSIDWSRTSEVTEKMKTMKDINTDTLFFPGRDSVLLLSNFPPDTSALTRAGISWSGTEDLGPYHLPLNLELPHDQSHLTFHYSGMKFNEQFDVVYRYILEGLDENWLPFTKEGKVDYRNIPQGTYTFRVRARGRNFLWSDEASISFVVHPPWWETWWARLLYVLMASFLVYGFLKFRLSEHKKKQKFLKESEVKFRTIFNNSKDAIGVTKNRMGVFFNPAYLKLFGYENAEELNGKLITEHIVERERVSKSIEERNAGRHAQIHYETTGLRKNGEEFDCEISVSQYELANETYTLGIVRDITQRKLNEKELARQTERLDELNNVLNQAQKLSHVGSWQWDMATDKAEWSDEMYNIYGVTKEDFYPSNENVSKAVLPEDLHKVEQSIGTLLMDEMFVPFEFRIKRPSGEIRKLHIVALEHGTIGNKNEKTIFGVTQDITERKIIEDKIAKSLEEKELLLRELYHRTKNNMQVISSMLSIQSGYTDSDEVKDVLEETKSRIMGMALVHEKLYQAKDLSYIDLKDYIIDLVELLKDSLLSKISNLEIITNLENTRTNIDTAIPCGIIINELFTNAIKHGFPDNRKGVIKISLTNNGDEICVSVLDNGVGIPTGFDFKNHDSYGLNSIIMLSEHQLGGSITLNTENDTEFILKFKEPLNSERV